MKFFIVIRKDISGLIKASSDPFVMNKYSNKFIQDAAFKFISIEKGEGEKQLTIVKQVIENNTTKEEIMQGSLENYPFNHYAFVSDNSIKIFEKKLMTKEIVENGWFTSSVKEESEIMMNEVCEFSVINFAMEPSDYVSSAPENKKQNLTKSEQNIYDLINNELKELFASKNLSKNCIVTELGFKNKKIKKE